MAGGGRAGALQGRTDSLHMRARQEKKEVHGSRFIFPRLKEATLNAPPTIPVIPITISLPTMPVIRLATLDDTNLHSRPSTSMSRTANLFFDFVGPVQR